MGHWISKLYDVLQSFTAADPAEVLMLGLDAAGKTTVLYKIKLNETVTTIPTIGFNVESVTPCPGVTFTVWDIGGQEKIRPLWQHYYAKAEGLLFVVDSCDRERFGEVREELFGILNNGDMRGVPVVVMANKQDLPGAAKPSELIEALALRKLVGHQWHIQSCCAPSGDGVYESMDAMSRLVREFKKSKKMYR